MFKSTFKAQAIFPLFIVSGCASIASPGKMDVSTLSGLRIDVPCADHFNLDTECHWPQTLLQPAPSEWKLKQELSRTFGADPQVVYDVTFRVRGVVEPKNFTGGEVRFAHLQSGGTPVKNDYNFYNLEISEPHALFTLNRNEDKVGHYTFPVDYTFTVPVRGGATVKIGAYDSNDVAIANHQRHVVTGVSPAPLPFDGQFFQVDVVAAQPAAAPAR
ncbi:MAG TPA: hypothetical protein VM240_11230 [Verrucomicrobiae bacterium]|nr:hypothetical protein [Verrucomicrobiae bacterium]